MSTLNTLQSSAKTTNTYPKLLVIAALMHLFTQKADAQISLWSNAQLHIQKNATMYVPGVQVDSWSISGKGTIVNYGDWAANTPVMSNADSVHLVMNGSVPQTVWGTVWMRTHKFTVNNAQWVTLTNGLNPDMQVDTLVMQNGNLNVGNNNIDIDWLAGESNQSYVTWQGTLTAQDTVNNQTNNPGNLGAKITTTENLWNVTVVRGHTSPVSWVLADARYQLTPENPQTQPANVSIVRTVTARESLLPSDPSVFSAFQEDNTLQFGQIPSTSDTLNDEIVIISLADITQRLSYGYLWDPLSIQLSELAANCEEWRVTVNRTTATETNSSHFTVYRSYNGVDRQAIGTVPAAGNSSQPQNYSFEYYETSPDNASIYVYLSETDNDGAEEMHYNKKVSYNCSDDIQVNNLHVYPNPSIDGNVTIEISSTKTQESQIHIYDMLGRIVYQDDLQLYKGKTQAYLQLSSLAAGQYMVRVWNISKRIQIIQ